MGALLLALTLAGPAMAQDRCWFGCDEVATGAEAAARTQAALGVELPPGAALVGLVEGGFQDAFVQARIEVDADGLGALLERLGADPGELRADPAMNLGPAGPDWWEEVSKDDLRSAPAALPRFSQATVAVAPGKGSGWTLLLWAFQT